MKINRLKLISSQLEELFTFYTERLGLPLLNQGASQFSVKVGHTELTFLGSPKPAYYHFAFNIPSFQSRMALEWLKQRVPILKDGTQEVIDFINWNAEAIYFKDPAGNILEFIARKNLLVEHPLPFSIQSLLNISEIGLPVSSVGETFHILSQKTGIIQYSGDLERFCAAGDEEGLFIIVNQKSKQWYPTNIPALPFYLDVEGTINDHPFQLELGDKGVKIL